MRFSDAVGAVSTVAVAINLSAATPPGMIADPVVRAAVLADPVVQPIVASFESLCATAAANPDLKAQCDAITGNNNPAAVIRALQNIASEETSSTTSSSQDNLNFANTGATSRLSALRGGATQTSIDDMAFNFDGKQIPMDAIAALLGFGNSANGAADSGEQDSGEPDSAGGLLGERFGLFFTGIARNGNRDAVRKTGCTVSANSDCVSESGFDFDGWQALLGGDYRFSPRLVAGVAVGAGKITADLNGSGGQLESRSSLITAYGSLTPSENTYLDFTYTHLRNRYNQFRNIDLRGLGLVGMQEFFARGKTTGNQDSFSLSGGYVFSSGATSFTPTLRFSTGRTTVDGFTENGNSVFNLIIREQKFSSLQYALGFNLNRAFSLDSGVFIPYANFEFVRENKNGAFDIRSNFVNNPTGPESLLHINAADSSFGRGELGFTFVREGGWQFGLSYSQTLAYQYLSSHSVQLTGRVEF